MKRKVTRVILAMVGVTVALVLAFAALFLIELWLYLR